MFLFLATKNVWSPFDSGCVLDGNQIFSITIQHTLTIKWQMKGVGFVLSFWKKNFMPQFPSWATKEFRSLFDGAGVLWQLNFFGHPRGEKGGGGG